MRVVTTSEEVFACYHRLCAPPPVGRGGSSKGGRAGAKQWARGEGIARAKQQSHYYNTKKRFGPDQEKAAAAEHAKVVRAGKAAKFRHSGGRKRRNDVQDDPMVSARTAYDVYRELQRANRAKKARPA